MTHGSYPPTHHGTYGRIYYLGRVGDLVVPTPPDAPRKPAGTIIFFWQPPRASVYLCL